MSAKLAAVMRRRRHSHTPSAPEAVNTNHPITTRAADGTGIPLSASGTG